MHEIHIPGCEVNEGTDEYRRVTGQEPAPSVTEDMLCTRKRAKGVKTKVLHESASGKLDWVMRLHMNA